MNGKYPDITDLEFPDRGEFVISECIKLYQNFNFELYRKFNFINCFAQYKQHRDGLGEGALDKWEDGFPEMSNYTKDFKAWIDHIFINQNGMELVSLKEMPTIDQCKAYPGFPCDDFPSDHLPICIEIVFKESTPQIY